MDDDLNSPMVLQALFDSARVINTIYDQKASISSEDLDELRKVWKDYAIDILGLRLGDEMANDKSQMSNKMSAFNGAVDYYSTSAWTLNAIKTGLPATKFVTTSLNLDSK